MSHDLKVCRKCCEEKPHVDFHRRKDRKDGLTAWCKACIKIRGETYYLANKEKVAEAGKKWREANKEITREQHRARYLTVNRRLSATLSAARKRSERNGKDFNITHEWLKTRWTQIEGRCEVTGIQMTLQRSPEETHRSPFNLSLDRRNNREGYTETNTRIVCVIVNIAINDFGEENFLTMCRAAIAHDLKARC